MAHDPLCPDLYSVLGTWSGGSVLIANEGEGSSVVTVAGRVEVLHAGETYRVNCRFCNDTRHRLYVNHLWYEHPWLAHCWNETECLKNPDNRRIFEGELLFKLAGSPVRIKNPGPPESDDPSVSVPAPGFVRELSRVERSHRAVEYLRARGFDPGYLSDVFAVGVCDGSQRYPAMSGRIYIPVFDSDRMVGWQGRFPYDPPRNPLTGKPDWKALGATKYYNRPGFRKSKYLYGPDCDWGLPYVVLVEGVTDVWRIGPAARAYLGIEMSQQQRALVANRWGRPGHVVVCMGDGEAHSNNERQATLLQDTLARLGARVVRVTLPPGQDPGGLTYADNWAHIERATAAVGCPIRRPY